MTLVLLWKYWFRNNLIRSNIKKKVFNASWDVRIRKALLWMWSRFKHFFIQTTYSINKVPVTEVAKMHRKCFTYILNRMLIWKHFNFIIQYIYIFASLTLNTTKHNTKNIPSQYKQSASKTILYSENSLIESDTQRHTPLSDDTLNTACHRTNLHNILNKVSTSVFLQ